jgi:hypothetical protein
VSTLFKPGHAIINVGLPSFAATIAAAGAEVVQLAWEPPAGGDHAVGMQLAALINHPGVEQANQRAYTAYLEAQPILVGVARAGEALPGFAGRMLLHAGPPIAFDRMNGPMQGAVAGALVFEGLAKNLDEATRLAASGAITFAPCNERQCVGSMAGVTSASMFMHVVQNKTHGNFAYTNLSEQMAKILRMGANDATVIARLEWMRDVLGPILAGAMRSAGEIDLRLLLSQALHMGDECHNRNSAGTTLLVQALAPHILEADFPTPQKRQVFDFIASSDYFSGPTWMALAKCALDAAHGIAHSTVVTTMCRNGVEFGIRVSGLAGNSWFTGPAQPVIGPMFAGYKPEDSGLDIGDSAITETYGLGGFAMACAPAVVGLIGGTADDAVRYTHEMAEITTDLNPNVTIPLLGFRGIATGIDVRKVVESNVLPIINTGIAHKQAGIGQVGAGLVRPPLACFTAALHALGERVASSE